MRAVHQGWRCMRRKAAQREGASDDGRVAGRVAHARGRAVMHGTIARGEPHCEDGLDARVV